MRMRATKNASITMPAAVVKDAERLAKRENCTMSELVREALRHYATSGRTRSDRGDLRIPRDADQRSELMSITIPK
jgi:metal-responsive CopG/Arc/MetJ family transcriptional regulator